MNTFEQRIVDLRNFIDEHGQEPTKSTDATLSSWLRHQRWKWRRDDLQPYKIEALKALGITPDKRQQQTTWMDGYRNFKKYVEQNGEVHIPQGPDCPDQKLAYWEHNTRKLYWKGRLDDRQIRLMEKLGFYWNVTDMYFESKLNRLKRYHKNTGKWTPPTTGRYKDLYDWVTRIRYKRRRGKLKKRYVKALTQLGFDWESPTQKVKKARRIMDDIDRNSRIDQIKKRFKLKQSA